MTSALICLKEKTEGSNSNSQEATPWFLWGITLWRNQFPRVWALGESDHESMLKQPFHGFNIPSSSSVLTLLICRAPARSQSRPYTMGICYSALDPALGFLSLHRWPWGLQLMFLNKMGRKVWGGKARTWDKSILEKTSLGISLCV